MKTPTAIPVIMLCLTLAGCCRTVCRDSTPLSEPADLLIQENYRILDTVTDLAYLGYHIARPGYQADLACSRAWGYYSLEVFLEGESLAYTRNFVIKDENGPGFTPQQNYYKNRKNFVRRQDGSAFNWRIAPDPAEAAHYRGEFRFEPSRLELIAEWTPREGLAGRAIPAHLYLGSLLLSSCPYRAVLADGSVVEGILPSDLPPEGTTLVGGATSGGISEIMFHTRKGAVTIRFLPACDAEQPELGLPQLVSGAGRKGQASGRALQIPIQLPAGRTDQMTRYRIVFEFPDARDR